MPKISRILLKLEGFKYTTSLYLNMGWYNIQLSKDASKICIIILPCGTYWYKCLTMGVSNSLDFFRWKIRTFFNGLINTCICRQHSNFLWRVVGNITEQNWNTLLLNFKKVVLNVISRMLPWSNLNVIFRFFGDT